MLFRLITLAIVSLSFVGCATTAQPKVSPVSQLQNKVVDLEQRMEEQEKEIVDLKYELKETASKLESQPVVPLEESSVEPQVSVPAKSFSDPTGIIKVEVSVSDIQKALKNAGFYEGKIDGKLGSKSRAGIIEFQKQHGLKSDGVIGQKTWAEMKTYLEK